MEIGQVGPRYGVRDYMRAVMTSSHARVEDTAGATTIARGLATRMQPQALSEAIVAELRSSILGPTLLELEVHDRKRLGKRSIDVEASIAGYFVLRRGGEDAERADEALGSLGAHYRVEGDRVRFDSMIQNVFLNAHALERVYERDRLDVGGMPARLRTSMRQTMRGLAVVDACDAEIRDAVQPEGQAERGFFPHATTLVPFGDGLLVVKRHFVMHAFPAAHRSEFRRNGRIGKGGARPPYHVHDRVVDGMTIHVHLAYVGRTYLSADDLRPEQREFRDLVVRALEDDAVRVAADDPWRPRGPHEDGHLDVPLDPEIGARLKALVGSCVRRPVDGPRPWILSMMLEADEIGRPCGQAGLAEFNRRRETRPPGRAIDHGEVR